MTSPAEEQLGELEPDVGCPDYLSDEAAARELARRIEGYWHAAGYPEVTCWAELTAGGTWTQRSTLDGSGSPPPATAVTTTEEPRAGARFHELEIAQDEILEDELTAPIAAVAAPLPPPGWCLWPLEGTPGGPLRWCRSRTLTGKPYCKAHLKLARHRPG